MSNYYRQLVEDDVDREMEAEKVKAASAEYFEVIKELQIIDTKLNTISQTIKEMLNVDT